MSDTQTESVPLPAHLNDCGCPQATRGMHLTTCVPAREHEAIPLRDRPEYEDGRRFRAVSWQYPLSLSATINLRVDLDPEAYIAAHRNEYDAFHLEAGFQEWEKPMCFLAAKITEAAEGLDLPFGYPRHVSRSYSFVDEVSEHPRWTAADTERIEQAS